MHQVEWHVPRLHLSRQCLFSGILYVSGPGYRIDIWLPGLAHFHAE